MKELRINEIVARSSEAIRLPEETTYLLNCLETMLDNYILQKLDLARRLAKAIQAEQKAMAGALADADVARLIPALRNDPKGQGLLLSIESLANQRNK